MKGDDRRERADGDSDDQVSVALSPGHGQLVLGDMEPLGRVDAALDLHKVLVVLCVGELEVVSERIVCDGVVVHHSGRCGRDPVANVEGGGLHSLDAQEVPLRERGFPKRKEDPVLCEITYQLQVLGLPCLEFVRLEGRLSQFKLIQRAFSVLFKVVVERLLDARW